MERTMKQIAPYLLKEHYLAHHRYSSDEYLIDQKTYRYIMNFISNFRYSMYDIPDDELIQCDKLIDGQHTERCTIRINQLVFEANPD